MRLPVYKFIRMIKIFYYDEQNCKRGLKNIIFK